jgi:SOS regulatory protein LexA
VPPPRPFAWRRSLGTARSALGGNDPTALNRLTKALADATQMAWLCHQRLFEMDPGLIDKGTIDDWKEFLQTLYYDSLEVYIEHADLVRPEHEERLHAHFAAIRDAAQKASSGLKYVNLAESEQEKRDAEVVNLRELWRRLKSTVELLAPYQQDHGRDEEQDEAGIQEAVYVPLIGRIAAGIPNLAEYSVEEYVPFPRRLVGNGSQCFALEVSGESMIGAGIAQGDLIAFHAQPEAVSGDIVVAMIDDEATLKTFRISGGNAELVPHNPAFTPIPVDSSTIIMGKVLAILRKA